MRILKLETTDKDLGKCEAAFDRTRPSTMKVTIDRRTLWRLYRDHQAMIDRLGHDVKTPEEIHP